MSMGEQPTHILTKMGVLTTFSISKKMTEKEVHTLMRSEKNKGKSEEEIVEKLGEKVMKEIIDAVHTGKLPGVIVGKVKPPIIPIKNIEELNRLVQVLATKLKQKKLEKLSLCYMINYLVGALGLKEEDFEEFHRKVQEAQEESDEED